MLPNELARLNYTYKGLLCQVKYWVKNISKT